MIPASPETYVVEVNSSSSEGYIKTPVVGWQMLAKRPLPVTLLGEHSLAVRGCAVLFPCGMVQSPMDTIAFDNIESWLESNPSAPKNHPAKEAAKAPEKPSSGAAYDIEWTDDVFKNNSFWAYNDGVQFEFVFQIDGGDPLPKASKKVVKIKRDEFMTFKKTGDVLTVEEIKNADPLDVEEVEEDEDAEDLI